MGKIYTQRKNLHKRDKRKMVTDQTRVIYIKERQIWRVLKFRCYTQLKTTLQFEKANWNSLIHISSF